MIRPRTFLPFFCSLTASLGFGAEPVVPLSTGEEHVWDDGRDEEAVIEDSSFVVDEPEVEEYLLGIVARLVSAEQITPEFFEVRVIRDTSLNAFALPHGVVYIHTGLLARMTNEAQLAAILGHEITHVTHHHAYRGIRDLRTKSTLLAVVSISSGAAGNYGSLIQLLGTVGTAAAVSGYSRSLEREADKVGWERMLNAGYKVDEAPEVFRMLMADLEQFERNEPFFFGTHPKLKDREKNFVKMNKRNKSPIGEDLGEERYTKGILPVLAINGELEMRAGQWIAARDQLWRYRAAQPDDPKGRWLVGEMERRAGPQGSEEEARQLLNEALALDSEFAPAHRSLGLIHYKDEEWEDAARHLGIFLELESNARDRAYLEAYIEKCETAIASNSSP